MIITVLIHLLANTVCSWWEHGHLEIAEANPAKLLATLFIFKITNFYFDTKTNNEYILNIIQNKWSFTKQFVLL